jgi:hypothetical protein
LSPCNKKPHIFVQIHTVTYSFNFAAARGHLASLDKMLRRQTELFCASFLSMLLLGYLDFPAAVFSSLFLENIQMAKCIFKTYCTKFMEYRKIASLADPSKSETTKHV